ncbi:MAG: DUF1552 domain-containing protein [Myxococcales bacterium]|nr:DUF1552 domain-containing protein [Myxococcales bacterium]
MISRRTLLKGLGVCIALPTLESSLERAAHAAAPLKKRFIGCFFGSGAPMPDGNNGDWGYSGQLGGALKPIADAGLKGNVSVLRGYRAVANFDVHWAGTAAFLSSSPVGTTSASNPSADPNYQKCAKTLDQYIADTAPNARIRSLHVGYNQVPNWDAAHDKTGSINYVNSIAWRDDTTPISNILSPMQLYTRVFGSGDNVSNQQAAYLIKRRQSILDGVLDQYKRHKARLAASDKQRLEAYAASIREVEGELANAALATNCQKPPAETAGESYVRNFRTMHKIIVAAMQCDLTRAATIMYNDGIGPNQPTSTVAGEQHDSAHNNWSRLIRINQIQVGLWADLLTRMKAAGLLSETVVLLGSNMSDGRSHSPANIPLLVASENVSGELKLGQEIYGVDAAKVSDKNQCRNLADLHLDLLKLYGVQKTKFGAGAYASSGKASGILT